MTWSEKHRASAALFLKTLVPRRGATCITPSPTNTPRRQESYSLLALTRIAGRARVRAPARCRSWTGPPPGFRCSSALRSLRYSAARDARRPAPRSPPRVPARRSRRASAHTRPGITGTHRPCTYHGCAAALGGHSQRQRLPPRERAEPQQEHARRQATYE